MTIVLRGLFAGMPGMIEDEHGDGKPWYSGFAKAPLSGRVQLHTDHLQGDGQADRSVHGGPEKALLAYCSDHYPRWREDLQRNDLQDGSFGENFALSELDESLVAIGDRFQVGTAIIEVSQPRQPCWKLARRCALPTMPAKAIANGRLGWYFRVIQPGTVAVGDELQCVARPYPEWSIAVINRLFLGPLDQGRQGLAPVLALSALSPEFVEICRKRFAQG